jgi:cytidylate kinase
MTRSTAPLKAAADAVTLDTTHLDADGAFRAALALVERKRTSK